MKDNLKTNLKPNEGSGFKSTFKRLKTVKRPEEDKNEFDIKPLSAAKAKLSTSTKTYRR